MAPGEIPQDMFKRSRMRADSWTMTWGNTSPLPSQDVPPSSRQVAASIDFTDPATGRKWFARLVFGENEGRMEPTELSLVARDGRGITGQSMREVPWGSLIADVRADFADEYRRLADEADGDGLRQAFSANAHLFDSRRGKAITTEQLEVVAQVYRDAVKFGESPTAAVEDVLNLGSRSTAAKWIGRARRAGLLGEATPGRPGERDEETKP